MSREQLLADYMTVLDDINRSTQVALEILQENAETSRMIIEEIMYGAEKDPSPVPPMTYMMTKEPEDYTEKIARSLADQIQSGGEDGVLMSIPLEADIDMKKLMTRVQEMLKADKNSEQDTKGDNNDDIDFRNEIFK